MAQKSKQLRSSSRLLALEPRLLFDGAVPAAIEQARETQSDARLQAEHASSNDHVTQEPPSDFSVAAAQFQLMAAPPSEGSISEVKITSDDGSVTVGEDDKQSSSVLKDWKVSGKGQITVTVSGQANGLGTLSHATDNDLSFTGTVDQVNAWLSNVKTSTHSLQTSKSKRATATTSPWPSPPTATKV